MPRTASSSINARVVGLSLRKARERQELTQAMLAQRLGVSSAYVQKVEAGRANPTIGQLANIATALECSLDIQFTPSIRIDPLAEFAER